MSLSRKIVALATVATAAVGLAISFTGVASGASAAAQFTVSVHADPGHVNTRLIGTTCGGTDIVITVDAFGSGGGSGMVKCGQASKTVAASSGGTFGYAFPVPGTQTAFMCQANALHASRGVTVFCSHVID